MIDINIGNTSSTHHKILRIEHADARDVLYVIGFCNLKNLSTSTKGPVASVAAATLGRQSNTSSVNLLIVAQKS